MSVNNDVCLSCIQWRASNRQDRPSVGIACRPTHTAAAVFRDYATVNETFWHFKL